MVRGQYAGLYWVIADLGHGASTQCQTGQTIKAEYSTAHPQGEHLGDIVRPYALRAPEVVLGLEWGPAIDIWSLGCLVLVFPLASRALR